MPADLRLSFRVDLADLPDEAVIFGSTPAMRTVRRKIEQILQDGAPVLLQGEYGTGKDLIARYLHARSLRSSGPFVKVNCAAIPAERLEAELLGSESRSGSGVKDVRTGLVEAAEGGTLFLEELDKMDLTLQGKLLHMLEAGCYLPVDGLQERPSNVRVVCASNSSLASAVNRGAFRRDLFYRIDGTCLHLPALRERRNDIPQLWEFFTERLARRFGRSTPRLTPKVLDAFRRLKWPGNLRELENCIARVIVFGEKEAVAAELRRQAAMGAPAEIGPQAALRRPRGAAFGLAWLQVPRLLPDSRARRRKIAGALKRRPRLPLYRVSSAGARRRPDRRRGFPRAG